MTQRTIAVIGTAGRGDDASRLSRVFYDRMYECLLATLAEWDVHAGVSGGAAYGDHLAVRAFLEGHLSELTIFAPSTWNGRGFVPNPHVRFNPGRTTNQYHEAFSRVVGADTLGEIADALDRGARMVVQEGFHARNLEVADMATDMVAFTFGAYRPFQQVDLRGEYRREDLSAFWDDFTSKDEGFRNAAAALLKDGGTQHTWTECWKADRKRHVNLTLMERALGSGTS